MSGGLLLHAKNKALIYCHRRHILIWKVLKHVNSDCYVLRSEECRLSWHNSILICMNIYNSINHIYNKSKKGTMWYETHQWFSIAHYHSANIPVPLKATYCSQRTKKDKVNGQNACPKVKCQLAWQQQMCTPMGPGISLKMTASEVTWRGSTYNAD